MNFSNMNKILITLVLLIFHSVILMAAPAERVRRLMRLADGTEVMATSMGDELWSFFVTDDGEVLEMAEEGLVRTGMNRQEYTENMLRRRMYVRRKIGTARSALLSQHGSKKVPVLLAAFPDKPFQVAEDSLRVNNFYQLYCNGYDDGTRYTGHGSIGSIRDYYMDMSLGEFQPEFVIIGPIVMDNGYAYYGKDSGSTHDVNYTAFLRELFTKATDCYDDWSQFDNDGDGIVDLTMVIYAGMGQNYTNSLGITDVIWPKEMPTSIAVNGVRIAGCSSTSETRPRSKSGDTIIDGTDGIGNFLHEMCHALGLPDFYDTKYVAFGMDYWSIMDSGGYIANGRGPAAMTAYERDFMGWQKLVELDEPCTLRLRSFASGGCGYKVVNDENPDEYYVLENRQQEGWDNKLCSYFNSGLMVSHIDYLQGAWTGNRVNVDPKHQRMTIIPANNSLIGMNSPETSSEYTYSLQGNLYPGYADNHELTDDSKPASVVFTGGYMGKPIYDITQEEDGTITLKYRPLGTLPEPENLLGADISDTEATLQWDEVQDAEAYNVELWQDDELVASTDSITTCYYNVENLDPETSYTFRIQALADKWRNSQWVESPIFRTIEDGLTEMTESAQAVRVYNMEGMFVTECFADEMRRLDMRGGIYILRYQNGKTKKIML